MKIKSNVYKWLTLLIVVGVFFIAFSFKENDNGKMVDVKEDGRIQYKWNPPAIPNELDFAGELVPLDRWEVKERLDREMIINTYGHSNMMYILLLTTRIFPEIERLLKEHGMPDDLKYVCVAESSLQNPTSPAGAVGYWQFMNATGLEHQLEINKEVDERYHLEKSTLAAIKYLKTAYDRFGTWTGAIASYNCGMGGYNRRAAFQGSYNYYDLLLPEETNRYVFRVLALKTIIENQKEYGFHIPETDYYKPPITRKIVVTESISNLSDFAKSQGTSYKMLKILNPWLRDTKLTISRGNSYEFLLPN